MKLGPRFRKSSYNSNSDTLIDKIYLETSSCYSNLCPAYKVSIDVDKNKLLYFGKMNVQRKGLIKGKIPSFHLNILVEFLESIPFFDLNNFYSGGHLDQPEIKITIRLKNGIEKTVVYDGQSGPAILYVIRLMIDETVKRSILKN